MLGCDCHPYRKGEVWVTFGAIPVRKATVSGLLGRDAAPLVSGPSSRVRFGKSGWDLGISLS